MDTPTLTAGQPPKCWKLVTVRADEVATSESKGDFLVLDGQVWQFRSIGHWPLRVYFFLCQTIGGREWNHRSVSLPTDRMVTALALDRAACERERARREDRRPRRGAR